MFIKLIFFSFFLFSYSLYASDVTVIELHKNKSLDQLVLEKENEVTHEDSADKLDINTENAVVEVSNESDDLNNDNNEDVSNNVLDNSDESNDENKSSEEVILITTESIFDVNEKIIHYHLESISEIQSQILYKEFLNILSNSNLEDQEKANDKIYYIVKKLYELGEIQKAYNLIKKINLDLLPNKEHVVYFEIIELNYLLSTFKLSEVCELKKILIEKSTIFPNYLLEKTDIFCLVLENKLAEANLLNSLLKDSEVSTDVTFQKLFEYMILENKDEINLTPINLINSKDLIFLYSAMLRINDLPLTEDFINIDPLNLSIPVILSDSTPMSIRIKAANKSFSDEVISSESLSALYQSADFNSKQFNNPETTIENLNNNNELIMAFYYQLANMQIFPEDRLKVIIDYWKFSKSVGLEKIAYSITKNIIDSFTPSTENSKYSMQIALAHISNKNFTEASKWLNIANELDTSKSELEYAKFLIALNDNNNLNTIISFLNSINNNLDTNTNIKSIETIDVLNRFLEINSSQTYNFDYKVIADERVMPSYFLIKDIQENMTGQNNLTLFLLSLISMNNKKWNELHPEHLNLLLEAYMIYDDGSLMSSIILEILNDLNIIQ